MEPVDSFTHAGLHVRILWEEFDQEDANPRSHDGNMGVMFCDYRGYTLGDSDAPDPRGHFVTCQKCDGDGEYLVEAEHVLVDDERVLCEPCEGVGEIEVSIVEYLVREHGAKVVLPLFVYEHSGITMSCGANLVTSEDNLRSTGRFVGDAAGWDTSTVGVIFDSKASHAERGDKDDLTVEQITEVLQSEVAYYAAYLEGNVFGYEVVQVELDEDGDPVDDGEVLDGCWGFLELNVHKDDAYVRQEAKAAAEYQAEKIVRERELANEAACRDIVTVIA